MPLNFLFLTVWVNTCTLVLSVKFYQIIFHQSLYLQWDKYVGLTHS